MITLHIQNDGTGTDLIGNYRYEVKVNLYVIASGEVNGHWKPNGWPMLMDMIVQQEMDRAEVENELCVCDTWE